ncbi:cysteine desulfurase family protein [Microbacterium sp.]|uniref:cysteine desulfurase family protein n=1 Tax=Microbacterium sp. TaxID=51671 RepID=UPI0039E542C0
MSTLYLDNAATSPVRPEVREAMLPFLGETFGNPSSHHAVGEAAASALDDARARVAQVLGMRRGDVVFCSGGTEANNLAVKGIVLGSDGRRLVTTAIEHESILGSADYLARRHGVEVVHAPVDANGVLSPSTLREALAEGAALVSFGHGNNEVGTVQDVAALVAVARDAGVPVHVDAVQSAGWLPLHGLGADAVTLSGHKLGAPKGIGVAGIRGRIPVEPLVHGGGQERGRRSGTENVAAAVGFARALELAEAERAEASARVAAFRDAFVAGVLSLVPSARLTGHPTRRLPSVAGFTFAGVNGETVLLELERRGVVGSSGAACAAGSDEPSHVLLALGIPPEVARTSVRITFPHRHMPVSAAELAALVADSVAAVA